MKSSRDADHADSESPEEHQLPGGTIPPRLRREARRVLIVEDERRLRDMLLISVRDMGWDPTGAGSAESAFRLMEQSPFAIALVDLNLPGIDGLELCERIRQRSRTMQFIVLTGFGNLDFARRAIRVEASDFLIKPCRMDELESAIQRAHGRWIERTSGFAYTAIPDAPSSESPAPSEDSAESGAASESVESIEQAERRLILAALARHHGSREAAAADLGISVRKLYYRLQQYQK
jgi:DNA-binding NtrC family response regulator